MKSLIEERSLKNADNLLDQIWNFRKGGGEFTG